MRSSRPKEGRPGWRERASTTWVLVALALALAACGTGGGEDGRSGARQDAGSSEVATKDTGAPFEEATPGEAHEHDVSQGDADVEAEQADLSPGPDADAAATLDVSPDDAGADAAEGEDVTEEVTVEVGEDAADEDTSGEDAVDDTEEDASAPDNPWPVPAIPDEPPEPCPAAVADPWYFQFLDNLCDDKTLPTHVDRDLACPVLDDSPVMVLADGGEVLYQPSSAPLVVDTEALAGLDLPAGLSVTVILIKRVDGVPHYRYLSDGSHEVARQPWSTTKFLAIANAAAALRIASDYEVGLTASAGGAPVGDYVSAVHTYDGQPYSSNSLGAWFHDIGGRQRANDLMHELWLERPASETFGGNYGDAPPPIGYTFTEPDGASITVAPDTATGFGNHLSLFTLAEALKRLVLHREDPEQRLPAIQWKDLRVLLYGAAGSEAYGAWGGMSADTAIYVQAGHDMDYVEARAAGRWRVFSKLGLGSQGQFTHVGYACWPVLDEGLQPVAGWGREFVIATHLDQGGADWDARDRLLAVAYRTIITRIMDGRL